MSYLGQYILYLMPVMYFIGRILVINLFCITGSYTINTNIYFRSIFFNKYNLISWANSKVSSPFFFILFQSK